MFDWYSSLSPSGRRTFWACCGGYALDAMDVQIYSFVVPTLIALWGISNTQAGAVATVALIMSAIGGWGAGLLSDRFGRVLTLQITIGCFALFTFLSGLTSNFGEILVTRGLQGLGFGGEWAAGSVLMAEVIAPRHRGRAVGFVQSSWSWGWALAAILATLMFSLLPQQIAWRMLFFIGILPAGVIFFIRRLVPDPEVYTASRAAGADHAPLLAIFKPGFLWVTVRGSVLALGAQGGYYAITTWLPTFLRTERHLSVIGSGAYLGVIITGSFCGYIVSAYLNDLLGRRRTFLVFAVGSMAIALGYTQIAISDGLMLVLGFPLGFFASGIFSGMGALFTELYPTELRGSGQGFCYNFGRGFAALFPVLVGYVAGFIPLGESVGLFAGGAYALVVVAALLLPETRGRELHSLAAAGD
nr:MFS transporter [uncultured Rhodopila sp.]